jgi:hypothetical protein
VAVPGGGRTDARKHALGDPVHHFVDQIRGSIDDIGNAAVFAFAYLMQSVTWQTAAGVFGIVIDGSPSSKSISLFVYRAADE